MTNQLPTPWGPAVLDACYRAADAILEVYEGHKAMNVEVKADNSPVTAADHAAHAVLDPVLSATGFPVLSEEGRSISYAERASWSTYWVVDPLDGTKEFIKRNGEFTVNIALVRDGQPIFGLVYAPVLGWLYAGGEGLGARKSVVRVGWDELWSEAQRLPARHPEALTVVASRSHANPETETLIAKWESAHGPIQRVSMGSSLKIGLVAEGRAHAYPRAAPTMEWDTAAGHAVLRAAGMELYELVPDAVAGFRRGNPLRYTKENLLNPPFLACGAPYLCGNA
ncbi:MAG: 3'(2'),5'-bisphosphate nucleotidase CysQ [Schleiferiaceae bacterium]